MAHHSSTGSGPGTISPSSLEPRSPVRNNDSAMRSAANTPTRILLRLDDLITNRCDRGLRVGADSEHTANIRSQIHFRLLQWKPFWAAAYVVRCNNIMPAFGICNVSSDVIMNAAGPILIADKAKFSGLEALKVLAGRVTSQELDSNPISIDESFAEYLVSNLVEPFDYITKDEYYCASKLWVRIPYQISRWIIKLLALDRKGLPYDPLSRLHDTYRRLETLMQANHDQSIHLSPNSISSIAIAPKGPPLLLTEAILFGHITDARYHPDLSSAFLPNPSKTGSSEHHYPKLAAFFEQEFSHYFASTSTAGPAVVLQSYLSVSLAMLQNHFIRTLDRYKPLLERMQTAFDATLAQHNIDSSSLDNGRLLASRLDEPTEVVDWSLSRIDQDSFLYKRLIALKELFASIEPNIRNPADSEPFGSRISKWRPSLSLEGIAFTAVVLGTFGHYSFRALISAGAQKR